MPKSTKTEAATTEAAATETPTAKPTTAKKVKAAKVAKPKAAKPKVVADEAKRSVHADEPTREVVWSERRVAVVKAMRKLKAITEASAVTAAAIAKAAGIDEDEVFRVKVILDVYRVNELLHNGYAKSVRPEGSRELHYYLTKTGQATKFPAKQPTAKE